jgi:hypothetical protein
MSASLTQVAGREWLDAVLQEPSTSSTRLSFSKITQRQFSGEPTGANRSRCLRHILIAEYPGWPKRLRPNL